jgi:hypothetical protein
MSFYLRQTAAWILFIIGDLIANTLLRVGWGWKAYQRAMMKSLALDKEGVIWKEVRQEAEWAKAEQYLEAKQTFSRDPLDFVDKDQDRIDDRAE